MSPRNGPELDAPLPPAGVRSRREDGWGGAKDVEKVYNNEVLIYHSNSNAVAVVLVIKHHSTSFIIQFLHAIFNAIP